MLRESKNKNDWAQANRNDELIVGKNSVIELLRAGNSVSSVIVSKGYRSKRIKSIIFKASEMEIPVKIVDSKKLDLLCKTDKHQGVIALASAKNYSSLDDILGFAKSKKEPEFIVVCDCIEDPHNLGAIIRSAECVGAHGVIIPTRRSASLNSTVRKSSAGALEHIMIARVLNIVTAVDNLKRRGIFVYGADVKGEVLWSNQNLFGPIALVVGSEGRGIGKLLKAHCDVLISIPIYGKTQSLNASVATGILLYEIARARFIRG
ncbi:MAG: 23S rRNA (guanosine(2251)-2'-O)-methyltransferase RlmB [Oscillospiraceae bacterium]|jgi:23S rRNA (guanosine2251-2'-O)-methyltransferase|nr:23S rRNA (guanosine(2251)-2'-O)-methyltransferase RlmB [Oscillospiraceae bacterium]